MNIDMRGLGLVAGSTALSVATNAPSADGTCGPGQINGANAGLSNNVCVSFDPGFMSGFISFFGLGDLLGSVPYSQQVSQIVAARSNAPYQFLGFIAAPVLLAAIAVGVTSK